MKKCSGCTIRSQQVEDLPHLERYSLWDILVTISGNKVLQHDRKNNTWYVFHGVPQFFFFFFLKDFVLKIEQATSTISATSPVSGFPPALPRQIMKHLFSLQPIRSQSPAVLMQRKKREKPMRNGPPLSPRILHTRQSPSEKCQRTGNQSL